MAGVVNACHGLQCALPPAGIDHLVRNNLLYVLTKYPYASAGPIGQEADDQLKCGTAQVVGVGLFHAPRDIDEQTQVWLRADGGLRLETGVCAKQHEKKQEDSRE